MVDPEVLVVDSREEFFFLVRIGEEEFRMAYRGGIIDAKIGKYFLMTPWHGCVTQLLFRMEEVQTRVRSTKTVPARVRAERVKRARGVA